MPYTVINSEPIPIKMWLNDIESSALDQAKNLANLPFAYKWIALMPDAHEGYGMPIGGVLAAKGAVIPNAVGVDIGCGVIAVQLQQDFDPDIVDRSALTKLRDKIIGIVPTGFSHQREDQQWVGFDVAPDIGIIQHELPAAKKQLGTLGGGNHFIEIQKGSDGRVWAMVHSGSRNFGFKVAKEYNMIAQNLCASWYSCLPTKDLAFLPDGTPEFEGYLTAMRYCVLFARINRERIMANVLSAIDDVFGCSIFTQKIDIAHNYATMEHHYGNNVMVHRKGAVRARPGESCVIPGSMGSCSYIAKGLGNPESFVSCSHGAGRQLGRKRAVQRLNLAEEQEKLNDVVHGLQTPRDLEEAPGAYKDISIVMANQSDLVEIETTLWPLLSVKGGAENVG